MKRKVVRLTENDLHRIVKNTVRRIFREDYEYWNKEQNIPNFTPSEELASNPEYHFLLGRLSRKAEDNGNQKLSDELNRKSDRTMPSRYSDTKQEYDDKDNY